MKIKKKLGIVGGMGPLATALFYQKITQLTKAASDFDHIECVILSVPQIPDRSAFLTGVPGAPNPADMLLNVCKYLEAQADIIAIPCMTSHHFYDEITAAVSVPVLDMQRICAEDAGYADNAGTKALGIMATQGTVISGRLKRILEEHGINPIFTDRQEAVTKLIYDIKAGNPPEPELFKSIIDELAGRGAQKVLLGCTELQIYENIEYAAAGGAVPLIDAAELLACRCIKECGGEVRR